MAFLSRSTRLVVQNRLYAVRSQDFFPGPWGFISDPLSVTIRVDGITDENWDSQDRPDVNFNNVEIGAGEESSQPEELNRNCNSAWFTMHVSTSDGQSFSFMNEHWDACSDDTIQRDEYEITREVDARNIIVSQTAGQGVNTFVIHWSKTTVSKF